MSQTLFVYTVPPQQERKAAEECRRARIKAYLPRSVIKKAKRPITPCYIYAEGKPIEAKHVRRRLGTVSRADVSRLQAFARLRPAKRQENPFKRGDIVIRSIGNGVEVTATVLEVRSRICIIAYEMISKTHQQAIAYDQLRPG